MDRVEFIHSVDKLQYPEMLINFFDHFVALKQVVEDNGTVSVNSCSGNKIVFSIKFKDSSVLSHAIAILQQMELNTNFTIYDRKISVHIETIIDDKEVIISLE